jgi:hypothetical protein
VLFLFYEARPFLFLSSIAPAVRCNLFQPYQGFEPWQGLEKGFSLPSGLKTNTLFQKNF